MLWVISYDVSDDRTRAKVATVLEEYGVRVQWSVFECRIDESTLAEVQKRISSVLVGSPEGSVRGYRVCENCASQGWVAGPSVTPDGASAYLIV